LFSAFSEGTVAFVGSVAEWDGTHWI